MRQVIGVLYVLLSIVLSVGARVVLVIICVGAFVQGNIDLAVLALIALMVADIQEDIREALRRSR